jgi:hypothetical protein
LDYYESVVFDYLRADRAIFINTEYCLQLNKSNNPDKSGSHWYCDALALDFKNNTIFLCEISYDSELKSLANRLRGWHEHWDKVRDAIIRESCLDGMSIKDWPIKPWLFIPSGTQAHLDRHLKRIAGGGELRFTHEVTHLEKVQPWLYKSWNREPPFPSACLLEE